MKIYHVTFSGPAHSGKSRTQEALLEREVIEVNSRPYLVCGTPEIATSLIDAIRGLIGETLEKAGVGDFSQDERKNAWDWKEGFQLMIGGGQGVVNRYAERFCKRVLGGAQAGDAKHIEKAIRLNSRHYKHPMRDLGFYQSLAGAIIIHDRNTPDGPGYIQKDMEDDIKKPQPGRYHMLEWLLDVLEGETQECINAEYVGHTVLFGSIPQGRVERLEEGVRREDPVDNRRVEDWMHKMYTLPHVSEGVSLVPAMFFAPQGPFMDPEDPRGKTQKLQLDDLVVNYDARTALALQYIKNYVAQKEAQDAAPLQAVSL